MEDHVIVIVIFKNLTTCCRYSILVLEGRSGKASSVAFPSMGAPPIEKVHSSAPTMENKMAIKCHTAISYTVCRGCLHICEGRQQVSIIFFYLSV